MEAVYKDFFGRFGVEGAESIDIDDEDDEKLFLVTPGYLILHKTSINNASNSIA